MHDVSDRIERHIHLRAPVSRVWRAIADSEEFGQWFGVKIEGPWVIGEPMRGCFEEPFTQAQMDEVLARVGLPSAPIATTLPEVFCVVEAIEPERCFRFRWIPYGIDADVDPATDPTTVVEFRLAAEGDGTMLTVTESGFDQVPLERRRRAFLMNSAGWSAQMDQIAAYLSAEAVA
ncbi:SRPBCC family protein [Haliangium sp.]|uniref:SRPBCC family protein n=1 Tax=Haliangium sp. TaxID=2663208 RepID=UPI003D0DEAD9